MKDFPIYILHYYTLQDALRGLCINNEPEGFVLFNAYAYTVSPQERLVLHDLPC